MTILTALTQRSRVERLMSAASRKKLAHRFYHFSQQLLFQLGR
ncbi:hypothetical protein [Nostoc sp. GT001]|nr:hypothetical protein [Nostoc sp. GT001]MDM9581670.1 hypothetical protein [Nostoc sp. GT001]MDZ7991501.1 hypothetical protein [Nostoc sp. EspVER01]